MRRDLAVLGGALVVAGAGLSVSPAGGAALSTVVTPAVLASLGLVVALLGAAVTAGSPPVSGGADDGGATDPPDDDRLGAEFDATLARVETMSAVELGRADAPEVLRRRLRAAAVALVASRRGVDREAAAAVVERGEWTDDPAAAAFLSSSVRAPPSVRWRERWSTTPRAVSRARRTAAALEGEL
jgi:hypothetical protein